MTTATLAIRGCNALIDNLYHISTNIYSKVMHNYADKCRTNDALTYFTNSTYEKNAMNEINHNSLLGFF